MHFPQQQLNTDFMTNKSQKAFYDDGAIELVYEQHGSFIASQHVHFHEAQLNVPGAYHQVEIH